MNMHFIDWLIVFAVLCFVTIVAISTKRYTRSVADFLSANRCAGRFLISVSMGIAGLGAITIISRFQMYYKAGFVPLWWDFLKIPLTMTIAISGFVLYRYRETKAMTLGQFFEIRYSSHFRKYAGVLAFSAGIVNFGIFPAVGSRFFMYFCGLPDAIVIAGYSVSTFVFLMTILLSISLFFVFLGGQITVIVTDFFQGIFCNIAFVIVLFVLCRMFKWSQISEILLAAPKDASLLNPLATTKVENFNMWYFLIGMIAVFYCYMSWQSQSGYNSSARSPHEAKMAKVIGCWKGLVQTVLLIMLPTCALVYLHHPDFAVEATAVRDVLSGINSEQVRDNMLVPIAIAHFLPVGIMGVLCAVMAVAFISTHDTFLHSWGCVLIQDCIMPFRKKPFTPKQHLLFLRLSIFVVAIFVFCFSLLFRQTEDILLFFANTGAIYLGGSGAVFIGGLYWKRGTTTGAWVAMITGSTIGTVSLLIRQITGDFFMNGQWVLFTAMVASTTMYILISLLDNKPVFNINRMLHRGKYAADGSDKNASMPPVGFKALGWTQEFTFWDKVFYIATTSWMLIMFAVSVIGTTWQLVFGIEPEAWLKFWYFYMVVTVVLGTVATIVFTIGGFVDLKHLFRTLAISKRDDLDDGMVVDHHNLCEESQENMEEELIKPDFDEQQNEARSIEDNIE